MYWCFFIEFCLVVFHPIRTSISVLIRDSKYHFPMLIFFFFLRYPFFTVGKAELGRPRQRNLQCSIWLILVVTVLAPRKKSFRAIIFWKHSGTQRHIIIKILADLWVHLIWKSSFDCLMLWKRDWKVIQLAENLFLIGCRGSWLKFISLHLGKLLVLTSKHVSTSVFFCSGCEIYFFFIIINFDTDPIISTSCDCQTWKSLNKS